MRDEILGGQKQRREEDRVLLNFLAMLPQLVDIHQDYRQRAFDPADSNDDSPLTPPATLDVNNPYSYNAKDQPQFMYNPPRDEYSPSPVDNQYYANYPPYYNNQPRRPAVYHHLDPINTSALPVPLEHPDQLSPFNPNFSASLSAPYTYSPSVPTITTAPPRRTPARPPPARPSPSRSPKPRHFTATPPPPPLLLPRPSPTESNSKTYSFIPLPGNAVKKRPRRRYDEIERLYQCSWPDCSKSYGTLNHLNAHVTMQKHGSKRSPNGVLRIIPPFNPVSHSAVQSSRSCASSGARRRKRQSIRASGCVRALTCSTAGGEHAVAFDRWPFPPKHRTQADAYAGAFVRDAVSRFTDKRNSPRSAARYEGHAGYEA
ncbi:zinc finger protein [Salix suchowensis]|nr:zinc finger protein [Salix suchowensis]